MKRAGGVFRKPLNRHQPKDERVREAPGKGTAAARTHEQRGEHARRRRRLQIKVDRAQMPRKPGRQQQDGEPPGAPHPAPRRLQPGESGGAEQHGPEDDEEHPVLSRPLSRRRRYRFNRFQPGRGRRSSSE